MQFYKLQIIIIIHPVFIYIRINVVLSNKIQSWAQWFTPEIPATGEVETKKIEVQGHPGQKVGKTSS
jgi:hypothetical protein